MASVISEIEKKERDNAVELLRKQIETEGKLIADYKDYGEKIVNVPVRRMLRMIMFDSQKHIEVLQAVIDIIQGKDVLREDRKDLKEGLKRHLSLEMESIKASEKILNYRWLVNTPGLKELLEGWRDDEKRHHQALKKLSNKLYIEANPNDFSTLFRGDDFLEERYLRSKRMQENLKKDK
jgi:rubrerythrin